MPEEDLHLSDHVCLQAHERGRLARMKRNGRLPSERTSRPRSQECARVCRHGLEAPFTQLTLRRGSTAPTPIPATAPKRSIKTCSGRNSSGRRRNS